ncbi:MAG: radical SAM protein [Acidobacteria bacterium]|jgi:hypothetical protein|nr:radical SAM protein [Acidobacteriota bacterium]
MPDATLLRLRLPDGRSATLLLGDTTTVLSVDDTLVSSWDLSGRPYALVREDGTYRRGLNGHLLHKREASADGPRLRRRLSAEEGAVSVEAARHEAELALGASVAPKAVHRLERIVSMDAAALGEDAARFLDASGPVGILPPDQYLSLVVRLTEGCSWNACTFCRLYRDMPFRWKTPDELRAHVAALRGYFGESIALRRGLFLGDANALCLATPHLLPLLEILAAEFPDAPTASFVDAWTGQRKSVREWRACAQLGLGRVYVGLETGDPDLLAWLRKPGTPDDAVALVTALHEADVDVGVIVLLGAGGERFSRAHATNTAAVLTRMGLGPRDLLYFSELVDDPSLEYARHAAGAPDLQALGPEECARQREAVLATFHPTEPASPPRTATYDIREFVY